MFSPLDIRLIFTLTICLIPHAIAVANASCYLRTGAIAPKNEPCNPDAEVSHCCEKDKHICFSNNLCLDTGANHFIEGGCTDDTWNDLACPQYCKDNIQTYYGDVRQCDGSLTAWVCGVNTADCANNFTLEQGFIDDRRLEKLTAIANLPTAYTVADTSAASQTANATATATQSSTTGSADAKATCSNTMLHSQEGPSALTAGLGAGLGVGLPLLMALITSLFFLRRSNKKLSDMQKHHGPPTLQPLLAEAHGDSRPYEKAGTPGVRQHEMEGYELTHISGAVANNASTINNYR